MGDGEMYLVGQTKNKKLIDDGKLDNATFILIKGPDNFGKTYLAKYIAKHYGMTYMLLDNKVDTIRDLVNTSNKNNNCIYHFKDFDKSSPAAKAALLKIAEETPKGMKIIVTTSAYNFLDTLVSRAYNLEMSPYTESDIMEYAKNLNIGDTLLNKLLNYIGEDVTPSLLFNLKDREDFEEILDLVIKTIESINNGLTLEDISSISSSFWKDDLDRVTIYLSLLSKSAGAINVNFIRNIYTIEGTRFILNKVTVGNYRNLIHNMLMEMV